MGALAINEGIKDMSVAFSIIEDLWKRNRNFCSEEYDDCLAYLSRILPFKLHVFDDSESWNGWSIPPKWDFVQATIKCKGRTIYEVTHPLQIIGLSKSFCGTITREELRKHLHYDHRDPWAIPYHFRQNYRPWDRGWGFCVPKNFYDSLEEGMYEVEILVKESRGNLKIAESTIQGKYPETFVFVAHLDHPGMANDDLAGVAVGVELFQKLSTLETKFTYKLVLVQEIIGSVFYLRQMESRRNVLESCFLEMLGTKTPLALQSSKEGKSFLEKAIEETMREKGISFRKGPFRSIICNDEIVWESYGIPMASLSRFPYPEYHSDKDSPEIIDRKSLEESVGIFYEAVMKLESSTLVQKLFEGVLALAHPSYDLYIDPGQPAFGTCKGDDVLKLRLLMDMIPLFPPVFFAEQIAEAVGLSDSIVLEYLEKWAEKKMILLK